MYPIKFENLYYKKIWGGRDLENFRKNLPEGDIGESWDIACHDNGMSIVANGEFKGKTFKELISEYGEKFVGKTLANKEFPLLLKLINSKDRLSVQVHPNDSLIVGTKNCDRSTFEKAIRENNTESYLNKIDIKKGDCFLIKSGLVHAICEGAIIAEIQQSSDITYRIYDYGRPRELHIEKSLDVIDFNLNAINESKNRLDKFEGYEKGVLCTSEYFTIEKYIINKSVTESSDINKFFIFTCVDGEGYIKCKGKEDVYIKKGDSIFIPASLGEYIIEGTLTVLKSYV